MTNCFPAPPADGAGTARAAVGVVPPDGVRISRSTSRGLHHVHVFVAEGTRLERVVTHLSGVDPRAVFVAATSGMSTELLFRVDDPDRDTQ